MQRRSFGALAALLILLAGPASAATISYTISGTTLNDAYLFGHPDPVAGPLSFSMSLYFDSHVPPTVDGRTSDVLPNDPRNSYTIGGQTAFYQGLGGFVETSIDFNSGLRELMLAGDTIVDYGFFKARSGYQFVLDSSAFTADYTLPGIYTDANALLNRVPGYNHSVIQTFDAVPGQNDARITYLHVDKLVITNSDYTSPPVSAVPLPTSLPLFGIAFAALGLIGLRARRLARMTATLWPCSAA